MNDGGPAFPCPDDYTQDGRPIYGSKNINGMSLRDYFAQAALTAYLAGRNGDARDTRKGLTARTCYEYADAMLAVREKKTTETPRGINMELLAALKECEAALDVAPCLCSGGFTCTCHLGKNAAKAAIAKAEGRAE
jgi:hypothetical protein